MAVFESRYVHKISPSDKDLGPPCHIYPADLKNRKMLAAALRKCLVLQRGEQISVWRVENDKIIVFPKASIWWSIVLTPAGGGQIPFESPVEKFRDMNRARSIQRSWYVVGYNYPRGHKDRRIKYQGGVFPTQISATHSEAWRDGRDGMFYMSVTKRRPRGWIADPKEMT